MNRPIAQRTTSIADELAGYLRSENPNNWCNKAPSDDAYYHSAPTSERDRIMQHGLQPAPPMWHEKWEGDMERNKQNNLLADQPTGVYMGKDDLTIPLRADQDVWKIDPSHLDRSKVQTDWRWNNGVVYPEPVPAQALSLHPDIGAENEMWKAQRPDQHPDVWQNTQDLAGDLAQKAQNDMNGNPWGIGQPTIASWQVITKVAAGYELAPEYCPHCSTALYSNGWTGYSTTDGQKIGWQCPGCGADMKEVVNRPVAQPVPKMAKAEHTPKLEDPESYEQETHEMPGGGSITVFKGLKQSAWHSSTIVQADNYAMDSRNFPDPSAPRAAKPPEHKGCTCQEGEKLHCPVHGMDATEADFDHSWSIPQAQPIGFSQDAPRSWQQAHSNIVQANYYHVAPAASRSAIQENGIDWSQRDPSMDWREPGDDRRYPNGNYLTNNWQKAREHADWDDRDIWHVNPTDHQLRPDPDPAWRGMGFYTPYAIEPSQIQLAMNADQVRAQATQPPGGAPPKSPWTMQSSFINTQKLAQELVKRAAESLQPIRMVGCPKCGQRYTPAPDDEDPRCPRCGYQIPYDGGEILNGWGPNDPMEESTGPYTHMRQPDEHDMFGPPNDARWSSVMMIPTATTTKEHAWHHISQTYPVTTVPGTTRLSRAP